MIGEMVSRILQVFRRSLHRIVHLRAPEAVDAFESMIRGLVKTRMTRGHVEVRVSLPGGRTVTGEASGVDQTGRLVVASPAGPIPVSAGDVIHVR